jgi:hypothetical protein
MGLMLGVLVVVAASGLAAASFVYWKWPARTAVAVPPENRTVEQPAPAPPTDPQPNDTSAPALAPPPASTGRAAPPKQTLAIASAPPTADVYVNGRHYGQTDSAGRLSVPGLSTGKYSVRIQREGFVDWQRDVELTSSPSVVTVRMEPVALLTLTVVTVPQDSEVFIDNRKASAGPNGEFVIANVKPGQHFIKAMREGFDDWSKVVSVATNETLTANLTRWPYERRLAESANRAGAEPDRALSALQQIVAEEPGRPEAYEAMANIYQRKKAFDQARDLFAKSLERGGKATFTVIHDHSGGLLESEADGWKSTCLGQLTIKATGVTFETPENNDRFSAGRAEIRDVGSNRYFGSGIGGFHIKVRRDKNERNFNLAPQTKDKVETKLITDLISKYVR